MRWWINYGSPQTGWRSSWGWECSMGTKDARKRYTHVYDRMVIEKGTQEKVLLKATSEKTASAAVIVLERTQALALLTLLVHVLKE